MNNMWMVEEILEEVRCLARMYSKAVTRCENEAKQYKDVYNTFDKFEATKNEYWRSRAVANKEFVDDLSARLETINDMIDDKAEEWEFSEDVKGDELRW